jgi:hypothetical protein
VRTALGRAPDNAELLTMLGYLLRMQQRYLDALVACDAAVAVAPDWGPPTRSEPGFCSTFTARRRRSRRRAKRSVSARTWLTGTSPSPRRCRRRTASTKRGKRHAKRCG